MSQSLPGIASDSQTFYQPDLDNVACEANQEQFSVFPLLLIPLHHLMVTKQGDRPQQRSHPIEAGFKEQEFLNLTTLRTKAQRKRDAL
jgi:hypothetical protein